MKEKIIVFLKEKKWYLIGAAGILLALVIVYISGCSAGMRCGK